MLSSNDSPPNKNFLKNLSALTFGPPLILVLITPPIAFEPYIKDLGPRIISI